MLDVLVFPRAAVLIGLSKLYFGLLRFIKDYLK